MRLLTLIHNVKDEWDGKIPLGMNRSRLWPDVRKIHLLASPCCSVCGKKDFLQVHHIVPFHMNATLELDPSNLITLCESTTRCHLVFGHCGNFRAINPNCVADVKAWNEKYKAAFEVLCAGSP